jgi:hypothetical protein
MTQNKLVSVCVDFDLIAFAEFFFENLDRQRTPGSILNGPLQRPRAIDRIVPFVGKQRLGVIRLSRAHIA